MNDQHARRHSVLLIPLIALLALALVAPGKADLPPPPEVTVPFCEAPPVIDGLLDDAAWQTAAVIEKWHVFRGDGTRDAARFKLTADEDWLYIGVRITHPTPDLIEPRVFERDGSVHQDDSVEIFLDPGTDGALYLHYLLNAANVRAEQQLTRTEGGTYEADRGWDVPWRSATRVTDEGWQAEIALPLGVAASYGELEALRLNLFANLVIPVIDPMGELAYTDRKSLTWSPVYRTFHEPARFGRVRGLGAAQPGMPFLAGLRSSRVGDYALEDERYGYALSAELHLLTPAEREITLRVTDRPLGAAPGHVEKTLTAQGPRVQPVEIFVPVETLASRTAELELVDARSGEVLQIYYLTDTGHLTLLSGVFPDRSYYTTETQARVRGLVALPEEARRGMTAAVLDDGGRIRGREPLRSNTPVIGFDLDDVPVGTHTWSLALLGADGEPVISQGFELIKREPRPGFEWKIDRFEGVLLRDGEPYFPYSMILYGIHPHNAPPFRLMSELGFNSVTRWVVAQPEAAIDYHATVEAHGLLLLEAPDRFVSGRSLTQLKSHEDFTDLYRAQAGRIEQGIREVRDSPHHYAYTGFDEPSRRQIEAGREFYRLIHDLDGYRPKAVLYASTIHRHEPDMTDWADILIIDPYWMPGGDAVRGLRGTINWISQCTYLSARRARAEGKPLFVTPMAELYSGVRKRVLLPRELHAQAYLAIIHGARGIDYFRWPLYHVQSVEAHRALASEMQVVGPIAVTPEIPQDIVYEPAAFEPEAGRFPDVQVSLRRNPAGGLVLLAANSRPYPVEATYRLELPGWTGPVTRLFDETEHPVTDGVFEDRLELLATRAYVLHADLPATGEPVRIHVSLESYPAEADPLYAAPGYPDSGRPGRRNLVQNPSFTEASLPGWPDYYIWLQTRGTQPGDPGHDDPMDFNLIGTDSALIAQDAETYWHGGASLRITSSAAAQRRWLNHWRGFLFTLVPPTPAPTRYVYSAYMKADREGVVARLVGLDDVWDLESPEAGAMPEFELTTEWQRYEHSGVLTPAISRYHQFGVRVYGDGIVWVDGLQVEPGAEATEFEP